MNPIEVREAGTNDVASIFSIQVACGLSPWPRSAYEAEVGREDAIVLVASTHSSQTIGFITGRIIPGGNGSSNGAEIYNLGVTEPHRLLGVGSALLNRFLDICERFAVDEVFLEVRQSNVGAIRFYGARGFVKSGERRNFYTDPMENAEMMTLKLCDRGSS